MVLSYSAILSAVIEVSTIGPVRIVTSACSETKSTTRSVTDN